MRDEKVELFDCGSCERPETHCQYCPIDTQPALIEPAAFWIKMVARKRSNSGSLPDPGGLMQQDELTMRRIELVERIVDKRAAAKDGHVEQHGEDHS